MTERMPAAVGQMLAEYGRLRTESAWDWGFDWRTDPLGTWETLPCRLPVALSRMVVGSPELAAAAQGTIDESDVLRRLCARSTPSPGVSIVRLRLGHPPGIRTGEASLSLRDVAATHWLVLDSRLDAPVDVRANGRRLTLVSHAVEVIAVDLEAGATGLNPEIDGTPLAVFQAIRDSWGAA